MNRKDKYKDVDRWRSTCRKQKRRYYGSRDFGDGSRRRWSEDEISLLLYGGGTDTELARQIGRSVRAVQAKRHNVKKGAL